MTNLSSNAPCANLGANTVSVANDHDRKLRDPVHQTSFPPINHSYIDPQNCNHNSFKIDVLRFSMCFSLFHKLLSPFFSFTFSPLCTLACWFHPPKLSLSRENYRARWPGRTTSFRFFSILNHYFPFISLYLRVPLPVNSRQSVNFVLINPFSDGRSSSRLHGGGFA